MSGNDGSGERPNARAALTVFGPVERYENFSDAEWVREIGAAASGTFLDQAAFELTISFVGLSGMFSMPHSLYRTYTAHPPLALAAFARIMGSIEDKLTEILPAAVCPQGSARRKAKVARVVRSTVATARGFVASYDIGASMTETWEGLFRDREHAIFHSSIAASLRMTFAGLYATYEAFVRRSVRDTETDPGSDVGDGRGLAKHFKQKFGSGLTERCLTRPEISRARLLRNAILHNGSRMTCELRALSDAVEHDGDMILVSPEDVRGLHDMLKGAALEIVRAAARTDTA